MTVQQTPLHISSVFFYPLAWKSIYNSFNVLCCWGDSGRMRSCDGEVRLCRVEVERGGGGESRCHVAEELDQDVRHLWVYF